MTRFEINKKYSMRSPCQYSCVWVYKVIKRTDKTITLEGEDGKIKVCRIKSDASEEYCKPLGSYSMSPSLCAKLGAF